MTDKQIRRAARDGARCTRDIARLCRAGSGCGGCQVTVEQILDEVHGDTQAHSDAAIYASPAENPLSTS